MTTEQAIELARKFAISQDCDVSKYDARAVQNEKHWQVDFYARDEKASPGGFFSVQFDEQTPSSMRLIPGK